MCSFFQVWYGCGFEYVTFVYTCGSLILTKLDPCKDRLNRLYRRFSLHEASSGSKEWPFAEFFLPCHHTTMGVPAKTIKRRIRLIAYKNRELVSFLDSRFPSSTCENHAFHPNQCTFVVLGRPDPRGLPAQTGSRLRRQLVDGGEGGPSSPLGERRDRPVLAHVDLYEGRHARLKLVRPIVKNIFWV